MYCLANDQRALQLSPDIEKLQRTVIKWEGTKNMKLNLFLETIYSTVQFIFSGPIEQIDHKGFALGLT